jgi:hypothetical protein
MTRLVLRLLLITLFLSTPSFGQASESERLGLEITPGTSLPTWMGVDLGYSFLNWQVHFGLGFIPSTYSKIIGSTAAALGGNAAYSDLIQAALQNNNLFKLGALYRFSNDKGWFVGLDYTIAKSSGQADIASVLEAATGRSFSNLKTALSVAGKASTVNLESDFDILAVNGGYSWQISDKIFLAGLAGIEKIVGQKVKLTTGLTTFESTAVGQSLIKSAQSDVEAILSAYGLSPFVGVELQIRL